MPNAFQSVAAPAFQPYGAIHARILVADSDAEARSLISGVLEQEHHAPILVATAAAAIEQLSQDASIDLIIFEFADTGQDMLQLLERLRALRPNAPIVLVGAVTDVSAAMAAVRHGAYDYVPKPVEQEQLITAVDRALEHRRLMQQNDLYRHNLEQLIAARTEMLQRTMHDLERSYDITLEALGDALDLKDSETEGHSKRVTAYTIALGRAMGLSESELRVIGRGAFLHDIGKMAIPDAILRKPEKLTAEEQAIMREHCVRGYRILRKIPFLRDAAEIVYSHQERYDGNGYPRNLRGDQIHIGARIFSIADTLDAITSDRPYRNANSFAAAQAEILRCSGTQFDPAIIDVFMHTPDAIWKELRNAITQQAKKFSPFTFAFEGSQRQVSGSPKKASE
ncbi:MAG TPA: HD domain-containing phosphohydrolase [Acidobacteriaceae bacterium]|jgi:putative nucleotidyltransferase with HDIG domain|nr:HD domain-containing phosphohydrolase [Acidobacteriaceae bacterium]